MTWWPHVLPAYVVGLIAALMFARAWADRAGTDSESLARMESGIVMSMLWPLAVLAFAAIALPRWVCVRVSEVCRAKR